MFRIGTRESGEIRIVDLGGRLNAGRAADDLRDVVGGIVSSGTRRVAINLSDVEYIDSIGLEALIEIFKSLEAAGGELKLFGLQPHPVELMRVTRLASIFDIQPDEAAALRSFSREPGRPVSES